MNESMINFKEVLKEKLKITRKKFCEIEQKV